MLHCSAHGMAWHGMAWHGMAVQSDERCWSGREWEEEVGALARRARVYGGW